MRIEIDKNKIPYVLTLKSGSKIYQLRIKHFKTNDRIYVDIMNENGEMLLENEKMICGRPLGWFISSDDNGDRNNDFLNCEIVPLSNNGKDIPVTLRDFCKSVFLEYFEKG